MPKVSYEQDDIYMHLYGDVHVSVDVEGNTNVNMGACKVVRIHPPGRFTFDALLHRRIGSIMSDDQIGHVYFRDPDLPVGLEEEASIINIPPRARLRVTMPFDPD